MTNRFPRLPAALLAALLVLIAPVLAYADSWAPAERQTISAADGSARFTVTPRDVASPLAYFEDKVEGREPAGQAPESSHRQPQGRLEVRQPDGSWRVAWERALVNDVAPVTVLVAPGGSHVITFDNWHSTGFGENVVVVYDGAGALVRSLELDDLLPQFVIDAMPRSVSSIQWSGEHRLSADARQLILQIVMPSLRASEGLDLSHFELAVDLATGRAAGVEPAMMERMTAGACEVHSATRGYARRRLAFLRDPLVAPAAGSERDWNDYLDEAFQRLAPAEPEPISWSTILRDPQAGNYGESREWVRRALRDDLFDALSFASPSQDNLAAVLVEEVARLRRGALRGKTVWIVVRGALWPQLEQAFARSGAQLVRIDPTQPILQRPERIPAEAEMPRFPVECEGRSAA